MKMFRFCRCCFSKTKKSEISNGASTIKSKNKSKGKEIEKKKKVNFSIPPPPSPQDLSHAVKPISSTPISEERSAENVSLSTSALSDRSNRSTSSVQAEIRSTVTIELFHKDGCDLGLVFTGGIDKGTPPKVAYLKPGGIAQFVVVKMTVTAFWQLLYRYRYSKNISDKCDSVEVGDTILSVNGTDTPLLRNSQISQLLQNSSGPTVLQLEYSLPNPEQMSFSVLCKRVEVTLERDSGGMFGITLRGGHHPDPARSRPLTVTQIRPGGSSDREGDLKVGDRILSVNNQLMRDYSLPQALALLQDPDLSTITLLVEYDVSVLEVVQNATGPLLVEVDKMPGYPLGVTLGKATYKDSSVIVIQSIRPASIADRCGALHVGDHLLSVNAEPVDGQCLDHVTTLINAVSSSQVQLEIVPVLLVKDCTVYSADDPDASLGWAGSEIGSASVVMGGECIGRSVSQSLDSVSSHMSRGTSCSMTTRVGSALLSAEVTPRDQWKHQHWDSLSKQSGGSAGANVLLSCNQAQVCHVDTTEVMLIARKHSFGLTIGPAPGTTGPSFRDSDILLEPPVITNIVPKGPAERCGVLQEGDRVLAINGQYLEGVTMSDVDSYIKDSGVKMLLLVEFNVAESIIPSSGVFVVKFAKRGADLGITISCPKNRKPDQHLVISDVKRGSVAHRTGTIQPGDQLLAIDNVRLDNCSLEDSARVLQDSQDIVKLTIKKDENFADEPDPTHLITYTVELPKFAGPLGIVISGSEQPFEPIFISSLTEGGLAAKTGALHAGDRLLAINGVSLRGKTLSDAVHLLQNAGQSVVLKITRPANKSGSHSKTSGKHHDSMDSALESWGSSGLEGNNKSNDNQRPRSQRAFDDSSNDSNPSNRTSGSHGAAGDTHAGVEPGDPEYRLGEGWPSGGALSPKSGGSSERPDEEWSRRLDDLEARRSCGVDDIPDSFSDLPDIAEITRTGANTGLSEDENHQTSRQHHDSASYSVSIPTGRLDDLDGLSDVTGAEIHLREVEEQLKNIFTPTPIELMRVTLVKQREEEDFGFSLCDGVFEKGVYVGALRPGGVAADALKPYDRILQVNSVSTKELECYQVVPLIGQFKNRVDLVISRNPLVWGGELRPRLETAIDDPYPLQSPTSFKSDPNISVRSRSAVSFKNEPSPHGDTLPRQTDRTKNCEKSFKSLR